MHTYRNLLGSAGRIAACSLFLAGSFALAQQSAANAAQSNVTLAAADPAPNLAAPAASYSSSSDSSSNNALAAERFNLSSAALDAAQPPPRRRYGRPNYSDGHTNADGSSKYAFMAGAGASIPTQDTSNYLTTSWAFQGGFGRNFSKKTAVLLQFDYDHFGMQGSVLNNQQNLYNSFCNSANQAAGNCSLIAGLDGNSHIWSFTLDPTYTFYGSDSGKTGAYVVGGVGFYHKVANFTVPSVGTYCDYFYGCYQYQSNQNIDHYTSNAAGFNGGLGLTYKPSRFAGERFYMEARYVYVANQARVGYPTNPNNLYPPNANKSYYIPVTFGLRF